MSAKPTPKAAMYMRGRREESKPRKCDTFTCACTLTYWDAKLGNDPLYNSFLDGWSDEASGTWQFAKENDVEVPTGAVVA